MNRPNIRPCFCNSPGSSHPNSRYPAVQEEVGGIENPTYPDIGRRNPYYVHGQGNDGCAPIDPQTLSTISSLRKKACQFLRSDSDSSASSPGHQCPHSNKCRGSNLLRQANDLIDYEPQSQFLRKMKQQCQYLQNDQPNIFSILDNCEEFSSQECQKCIDRAKLVLSVGDQIKCNKFKSPAEVPHHNFPSNYQINGINNLEGNQMYPTNHQHFCQMNGLTDNQRMPRDSRTLPRSNLEGIIEEKSEMILQKSTKDREKRGVHGKKSEHKSRSKKPAKGRCRRKRKSDSSDKCESGDEFEPNLKKPHENSCERCWRYASPSRSPVNKPDQRYDPNFRRGHSCVDFNQERGDGDLEAPRKHTSPCKNLQPISSRDKVPMSSQVQSTRQQAEVIQQKAHSNPHKTQFSCQETHFRQQGAPCSPQVAQHGPQATQYGPHAAQYHPQAAQFGPQVAQYGPQKAQCIQQHPQSQANSSFTKVKELMYNYSRSKSPDKNAPQPQPVEGAQKSTASPRILQSEAARKPRPKSFPAGAPLLDPNNVPGHLLNATDYCDLCFKSKPGLYQYETNKKSVKLTGNQTERPVGEKFTRPSTAGTPLKTPTPGMSNRSGPSPKSSSTPKKSIKPKKSSSPDQCKVSDASPGASQSKQNSPKAKSPKTLVDFNEPCTSDSDSTVYAQVIVKTYDNPCTPDQPDGQTQPHNKKSPSPKIQSQNANSPRKSSNKESPKKVQSSATIENLSPITSGRPQTAYELPTEHDIYPGLRGMNDPYTGTHPIRDCWCPPRAPFLKGNICNNPDPDQIFCCHCNWQENRKNEEQRIRIPPSSQRNERPKPRCNEPSDGQMASGRRRASPRDNSTEEYFLESVYPQVEDHKMECPYRAFQRERKAANDTSWEADYQTLKEYCYKHPGELQYQVTTKTESPFRKSEYQPTKYALFYMTENKQDKGNDVEVLVEELTQACPKKSDSRTRDITDKMKRIMECPSDSMALRFQKGVSESCKTPPSSRILYF